MMGTRGHLTSLDGLRGVSALVVMIGHIAYVLHDSMSLHDRSFVVLRALSRTGHPAVLLFFVLSGFVLYLAFLNNPRVPYHEYIVRRICRIYPALLAALTLALLLNIFQHPLPEIGLGHWAHANWAYAPSIELFVRNVLLLGNLRDDSKLDPVIWSLVIELRFSIIFPILAAVCYRSRLWLIFAAAVCYCCGVYYIYNSGLQQPIQHGLVPLGSVAILLYYIPAFIFGITAAHIYRTEIYRVTLSSKQEAILILAALTLGKIANSDLIWALVATIIIYISCLDGFLARQLNKSLCQFLGKISYSLYLVHFPIIMFFSFAANPYISKFWVIIAAPIMSLAVAAIMYRFVEKPGVTVGKHFVAWRAAQHRLVGR